MLHDLDRTLEKLLIERANLNKAEIDIAFEQPTSEWATRINRPTINCWAFDLRENAKLRNMDMNMVQSGNWAKLQLPPLRFNVTYLITAWTRRPEDEHVLLWRALAALCKSTILKADDCEGNLRLQPYDMPIQVAQMGEQTFNMTDLWSVLDNQLRLGFTCTVTLALDPELEFDVPLVLEAHIGIGQSENLPENQTILVPDLEIIQQAEITDEAPEQEEKIQRSKPVFKDQKKHIIRKNRGDK